MPPRPGLRLVVANLYVVNQYRGFAAALGWCRKGAAVVRATAAERPELHFGDADAPLLPQIDGRKRFVAGTAGGGGRRCRRAGEKFARSAAI